MQVTECENYLGVGIGLGPRGYSCVKPGWLMKLLGGHYGIEKRGEAICSSF